MLPLALWTALALRLGEFTPEIRYFWPAFVASSLVCLPVFARLGLYRQVVRYMGYLAMVAILKGVTITTIAITAVAYMVPLFGFPRSVPLIFWVLSLLYVAATRFGIRRYFEWLSSRAHARTPVIIYGAGTIGVALARSLRQQGDFMPVAFVDDDTRMQRRVVVGIMVHAASRLPGLLKRTQAKQVLVAVAQTQDRKRIIESLEPLEVHVRLITEFADLVAGNKSLTNIRDVEIEDLLGRDQVDPMPHLLQGSVNGKSVLVTGAGGSIGSELCRQIVRQKPVKLVLLDQTEYELYRVQNEIHRICRVEVLDVQIVTVLGSVTDRGLMRGTFTNHVIHTVYHAAAYKHVSLVEENALQGIKNNTFGTLHAAEGAMESGVRKFILISTDKAVRTASAMGASKRLAEMVLQALQGRSTTSFSIVRFGNVLGSSGSVVPLFLDQIDNGGPVTVTHPDVTRYFMTISEAAELVLQAGSMSQGGDLFLLDMGQPIRILDLAMRIIRLKGYTVKDEENPNGDIEIRFTGLKAGEKLHEELLVGATAARTEHQKIMRAEEVFVPWLELSGALNTLEYACDNFDHKTIQTFLKGLLEGADLAEQLSELKSSAGVLHLPR